MNSNQWFIAVVAIASAIIILGLVLAVHWLDEYYRED